MNRVNPTFVDVTMLSVPRGLGATHQSLSQLQVTPSGQAFGKQAYLPQMVSPSMMGFQPQMQAISPWQQAVSPWQQAVSPWQQAVSPWQQAVSPWQQAMSPWQQAMSPWQQAMSPWQQAMSPWQQAAISPWAKGVSPISGLGQVSPIFGQTMLPGVQPFTVCTTAVSPIGRMF